MKSYSLRYIGQDELSYAILELQKDRFFEELKGKYWNQSNLRMCPLSDDQEGITLQSLGGVFIATLCGLIMAMITLVIEIMYYQKKQKSLALITQVKPLDVNEPTKFDWLNTKGKDKDLTKKVKATPKKPTKLTPPPSFEAATLRGRKATGAVALSTGKFKPSTQEHLHFRRDFTGTQPRIAFIE